MDWILQNLENVVVPIIILVLYGLGHAAQKKQKAGNKPADARQKEADPAETRRVEQSQEEIRRKIAERMGRVQPQPPPTKRVPPQAKQSESRKPFLEEGRSGPQPPRKYTEPAREPTLQPATTPSFQTKTYQQEIEAKMREVRALEAQIKTMPSSTEWGVRASSSISRGELRTQLFHDLSSSVGRKKAILMSEILGSPVGIKGPSGWKAHG